MTTSVPFATDQPIASSKQDRFSRKQFAYRVAHTIANRSDPSSIVVGIYGAWGEGKTSVLRMIDEALATENEVKTFWFNPWRYREEEPLLEQFFRSMAHALGSSINSKAEDLGGLLRKYKYFVAPMLMIGGVVAKTMAGVPPTVGDAAKITGEQVGDFADGLSDVDAETLKERIDRHLSDGTTRLVVFMDDLDRLDQQEIQAVFRLVKLTLSFSNTAFVLAFDDDVVEQALTPQFGSASRKFLEKIIQVPLQLPRADVLILRKFCFAGVDEALQLAGIELSDDESRRFVQVFDTGILPRLNTPRMARRYGNTLAFALPILKDEVNPADLMLIEAVRVFYPLLYASIRENRDLYVWSLDDLLSSADQGFPERKKQAILGALKDFSERDRDAAIDIVKALFPRNVSLLSEQMVGYSDETIDSWNLEKRITAHEYFDRYFGYGISPNDISDAQFFAFVASLELGRTSQEVNAEVERFCSDGRVERFLEKVRVASRTLPVRQRGLLAQAIASNAKLFRGEHSTAGLGLGNLRESAALRIYWLLQRLPAADRFSAVTKCMNVVDDPMFALEIVRWHSVDESKEEAPITREELVSLRSAAVAKVRLSAESASPWTVFGRDTASALWHWADVEGKECTSRHLLQRFTENPRETLLFLETMLSNATQWFTGRRIRMAFTKQNYTSVVAVVDADRVADILRGLGFQPELGDRYEQPAGAPEEQTARRFLALHEEAQQVIDVSDAEEGQPEAS